MTKKQKRRVEQERDQQKDPETLENEWQKHVAIKKRLATLRRVENAPKPKHPKLWMILFTLAIASVCGLYGFQHYYHNDRLFLLILCAIVAAVGFVYLGYCWKKRMTYRGLFRGTTGEWIYRDGEPFFYWAQMALYMCVEAAIIYAFFYLLLTKVAA